jgi:hypothetical protein
MQEKEQIAMVPLASFETMSAHYVRIIKWLVISLVISICLSFGLFAATYIFSTEVVETQEIGATQEGDGSYFVGGGDINYGQADSPH